MKKIILVSTLAISLWSCQIENIDPYIHSIERDRRSKDSFLKVSPESPFEEVMRRNFLALDYYAVDSVYRTVATVEVLSIPDTVFMNTKKGEHRPFLRYAFFNFTLKKKPMKLTAFLPVKRKKTDGEPELFLPFNDATNGKETYGGGRYIDIAYHNEKTITLDFNKCYNPYCNYSDNFSCPIPPPENKLSEKIEAGEMTYKPFF